MNEYRGPNKEEREQDINFLKHIIVEIIDYARKNAIDEDNAIIAIAELMIYIFKREESNETGSTRDKHKGADPELDRQRL